jgi:uncharacterized membrane protein YdjX (TVP38/TMEM64 family)
MQHLLDWVHLILTDYPLAAPIIFVGVHTLMAVSLLPCSPVTLMAGALWGESYGLAISVIAALVSEAATFLLARGFLHNKVERFIVHRYPTMAAILIQAAVHDWKLIAITQLNPLIPSSSLGYAYGLTRISFARFLLFSAVFMIPLQVLLVATGASVSGSITSKESLGLAAGLLASVVILRLTSKHIFRRLCTLFGIKNGT